MNYNYQKELIEVGVDECARGSIFGRIYGAAVIYPKEGINKDFQNLLNDSKKLTAKKREYLYDLIIENVDAYSISWVDEKDIDKFGIQYANYKVFHDSIDKLKIKPEYIIVDGNRFKEYKYNDKIIPHQCIIKGDSKFYSIACASILAKVSHDRYIKDLVEKNPILNNYDLGNNMGYGTKKHIFAIKNNGYSNYHRLSYKIKALQKKID